MRIIKYCFIIKSEYKNDITNPKKLKTTKNNCMKEKFVILTSNNLSFLKFLIEKKVWERNN